MVSEAVPAMRLTAGAPTSVLISSLARSYWGVLDGPEWRAARSILQALTLAPSSKKEINQFDNAGKVFTTATQLQRISGYCERWTRIALQTLEEMGVIRWTRGMIVSGNPTSSLFTVVKRKLVELISFARPRSKQIDEEQRNRFIARLADILRRRRGKDRSTRAPEAVRIPSKGAGGLQTNDLQARSACSRHAEATASPSNSLGGYPACRVSRVRKKLFREVDEDKREALDLFNASANSVDSSSALSPATIEDFISNYKEDDMGIPIPAAHLDRLPDMCPHGEADPKQCCDCVDATRDELEMIAYKTKVRRTAAYQKAKAKGAFEVSNEEIVRARAAQIAAAEAIAAGIKPGLEYAYRVADRINELAEEWRARGDSVLWN